MFAKDIRGAKILNNLSSKDLFNPIYTSGYIHLAAVSILGLLNLLDYLNDQHPPINFPQPTQFPYWYS